MKRNVILFCFFLSIAYLCAAADKTAQTTDSDHEKIVIIICEKIEKIYPDKKIAVLHHISTAGNDLPMVSTRDWDHPNDIVFYSNVSQKNRNDIQHGILQLSQ